MQKAKSPIVGRGLGCFRYRGKLMNPQFRVIVIGGTGQVGSAVVQALLAESVCREVVMVTRKPVVIADPARLRNVMMDTGAADFEMHVADLARDVVAGGDRVSAVSCVGVGSGEGSACRERCPRSSRRRATRRQFSSSSSPRPRSLRLLR